MTLNRTKQRLNILSDDVKPYKTRLNILSDAFKPYKTRLNILSDDVKPYKIKFDIFDYWRNTIQNKVEQYTQKKENIV